MSGAGDRRRKLLRSRTVQIAAVEALLALAIDVQAGVNGAPLMALVMIPVVVISTGLLFAAAVALTTPAAGRK